MSNKPLFTLKGFWNGEHTATFTACIVKPHFNSEKPMYWHNVFAGEERQGIEITYAGQTWVIDNETGDGYYKVAIGMGSPQCGHKSYSDFDFVRYIPKEEMLIAYSPMAAKIEQDRINEYQKTNYPIEFAENQRLLESLRKYQAMSPMEKIAHINKNMMVKPASPSKQFHHKGKRDGKGKR